MKLDDTDPFEPINADIFSVLRLGRHDGSKVELRYALLLDQACCNDRLLDVHHAKRKLDDLRHPTA